MSLKRIVPCILGLIVASANAQLKKPIDSLIPRESSRAYLTPSSPSRGHDSSAVDAKGVRDQGSDYVGIAPWLNDRVKSVAPEYPHSWVFLHQGEGVFRVSLDLHSGSVTRVSVAKSTGFKELDESAIAALSKWRWKPGRWKEIDLPVTFAIGAPLPARAVRLPPP